MVGYEVGEQHEDPLRCSVKYSFVWESDPDEKVLVCFPPLSCSLISPHREISPALSSGLHLN